MPVADDAALGDAALVDCSVEPDAARAPHAPGAARGAGRSDGAVAARAALFVALVLAMAYAVAFMETLTISHFPYYDFEDRDMAYTVGSAFYGIYFIVSFPVHQLVGNAVHPV